MIHIIIGTKAQLIKMAPVIKGIESRGISCNLINLGQHAATVRELLKLFEIQNSRGVLKGMGQKDISTIMGLVWWLLKLLMAILFRPGSSYHPVPH